MNMEILWNMAHFSIFKGKDVMLNMDKSSMFDFSEVITQPSVFELDYTPPKIIGRENEQLEVAHGLVRKLNLYVTGGVGDGKTLVVKKVVDEYENQKLDTKLKVVYIPCTRYASLKHIYREIYHNITDKPLPSRLSRVDLIRYLKDYNNVCIIFDEFEILKKEFPTLIKDLEQFKWMGIFITNHTLFHKNIKNEILGRVAWKHVPFTPYSIDQVIKILKQRKNLGMEKNSLNSKEIERIAKHAREVNADVRILLKGLYHAGLRAEKENKDKIPAKYVIEYLNSHTLALNFNDLKKFNLEKKMVIRILLDNRNDGMLTGHLLTEINKMLIDEYGLKPISRTKLHYILTDLFLAEVIERNPTILSNGGKSNFNKINSNLIMSQDDVDGFKKILSEEIKLDVNLEKKRK